MTALGRPVSHALEVPHGLLAPELREVLRVIDAVHGDGVLPRIPLGWAAIANEEGIYRFDEITGLPVRIIVSSIGKQLRLAVAHEIGHLLDHQGIGDAGTFASSHGRSLNAWREAVRASRAIRSLSELGRRDTIRVARSGGRIVPVAVSTALVRYLLTDHELWARSYAQFIAIRSDDPLLLAELDARRGSRPGLIDYHLQWEDVDFAPIEFEIERLFRRLRWLA